MAEEGPVRVILGAYGRVKSAIDAPQTTVSQGALCTPEPVAAGELAVFEESNGALVIQAQSPSRRAWGVLGTSANRVGNNRVTLLKQGPEPARPDEIS